MIINVNRDILRVVDRQMYEESAMKEYNDRVNHLIDLMNERNQLNFEIKELIDELELNDE